MKFVTTVTTGSPKQVPPAILAYNGKEAVKLSDCLWVVPLNILLS
jgi:hypothetical protein